ncbi:MAG: 30S ribosomal protein S8e [Candidatus Thermoplasmatota archaeon]
MALWQGRSRRKVTGGRYRQWRNKRKFEIGTEQQHAVVGEQYVKRYRIRGGNQKLRAMRVGTVNARDPKTGKVEKTAIATVKSNPANPNYVQRNIVTKGAVIQTELGLVRVTSRPGQDGVLNGVLVE